MRTPEEEAEGKAAVEAVLVEDYPDEIELRDTYRLVIGALFFGANADRLARVFGLNRDKFVRPRAKRLRASGCWVGDKVALESEETASTELTLMVLVAEGAVQASPHPDGGKALSLAPEARAGIEAALNESSCSPT